MRCTVPLLSTRCLWFLIEPLMKSESYSYSFYRKLVENIKQTKDVQCLDNPDAHKVLISTRIIFIFVLY